MGGAVRLELADVDLWWSAEAECLEHHLPGDPVECLFPDVRVALPFCPLWVNNLLPMKRNDFLYPELLDSMARAGQHEPIMYVEVPDWGIVIADGHHRLAAALELGWRFIEAEPGHEEISQWIIGQVNFHRSLLPI